MATSVEEPAAKAMGLHGEARALLAERLVESLQDRGIFNRTKQREIKHILQICASQSFS
jgi:hypothetical protein